MSTLVKITDVRICIGVTTPESLQSVFDCIKILKDNNIPYANLLYPEESQYTNVFENLSTWTFGFDITQYTFTDFPIITWKEYYDDYEICDQVAQSVSELETSNLITYKDLVV